VVRVDVIFLLILLLLLGVSYALVGLLASLGDVGRGNRS
jgi:hypothetical protein